MKGEPVRGEPNGPNRGGPMNHDGTVNRDDGPMSRAIVSFEHVTYHYPGNEAPALQDVSLQIEPGELVLLAGLSGHGKSTLLRAACGLVPHHHGGRFAGTVVIAGMDTRAHTPARTGVVAGALFQDPETQLVTSSVRSELALALESRGHGASAVARGVEEVALALGIDGLLDRSVHELSGGEQQRVALGAALAGRPPVILLDEPTSQLDPVAGDELIGLLRRLNQEWETTVLLAEHRLERCLPAADRVIAMRTGRVAYDGDPASFQAWAARESPALQTPAAKMFTLAGLRPLPVGVRQARASLRERGLLGSEDGGAPGLVDASAVPGEVENASHADVSQTDTSHAVVSHAENGASHLGRSRHDATLRLRGVWHELLDGPAILRGVELTLKPGESVALMGRNGAGKSTLLRHAAGLLEPTRGKVQRAGRVALLLQNPGDYFIHEYVREEATPAALQAVGLAHMAERNPRDLSGGERQRLALAIVTGEGEPPAVLALDEPTRGMDREAKAELARELRGRARSGQAVIVATHDPEFAAACAQRAVLLADGRVIADGPASELLSGGWYFATETARILGGAAGALLPEEGVELLRARAEPENARGTPDAQGTSGTAQGTLGAQGAPSAPGSTLEAVA
jgi:energy-coupling factor transport system ATP-binding protein